MGTKKKLNPQVLRNHRIAEVRRLRRQINDLVTALRWAMDHVQAPDRMPGMTGKEGLEWERRRNQFERMLEKL